MIGILSFLLLILVTIFINQIAGILLEQTGIDRSRAVLESLSAWTTCGFTTSESEEFVSHPVRRHIIMTLMFFGHAGIAAAGAALILGFIKHSEAHDKIGVKLPILVVGLIILAVIRKSDWLSSLIVKVSPLMLKHIRNKEHTDKVRWLGQLAGNCRIAEIFINDEHPAVKREISALPFEDYKLQLLGLIGPNDNFEPGESSKKLQANDKLVTFGNPDDIIAFRKRISGES